MDGFYAGYFTAASGAGFALFILKKGDLVGVDAGGVKFDGTYAETADGSLAGEVTVDAPPNTTLIQGITAGPEGLKYTLPITLPSNLETQPFLRIVTPLGPVNAKLVKLRGL